MPKSSNSKKWTLPALLLPAWIALFALIGHFAWHFAARCIAASHGFVGKYALLLLVSWKTMLLLLLLALAGLGARPLAKLLQAKGMARPRSWALLLGLAGLVLALQSGIYLGGQSQHGQNRWGFRRNWSPGHTVTVQLPWPGFAPMQVTVNAQSYRDGDWQIPAQDDGTIRVLLVGDSQVFGHGIPDKAGLLDTQLEQRLNTGTPRWDVWNIANHPAALWYFTEAVQRIAPDARPRYAVLSVFPQDIAFADEQKALADQPAWVASLGDHVDLVGDLLWMAHNVWWPGEESDLSRDPEVVAANAAAFERLLRFAAAQHVHLVVWEALGPLPFFDRYRGRPGVTFVDWASAIGKDCKAAGEQCAWGRNPQLAFPDGHPLPATNGLIAEVLARTLRKLESERLLR